MSGKISKGCDFCGGFPARLTGRCHPLAPLHIEMVDSQTMVIRCYVPECNKLVAVLKVAEVLPASEYDET